MISRLNQILIASATVAPLLFTIGIVMILKYPSGYYCGWVDLFRDGLFPNRVIWWIPTFLILFTLVLLICVKHFLDSLFKSKRGCKSLKLSNLALSKSLNYLQLVALLPPWLTFLLRKEQIIVLFLSVALYLILVFIVSKQGCSNIIYRLIGYKIYEGINSNGMPITLLSNRSWHNPNDIRRIVLLAESLALVV